MGSARMCDYCYLQAAGTIISSGIINFRTPGGSAMRAEAEQLRSALEQTLNPDDSVRKPAEQLLRTSETVSNF